MQYPNQQLIENFYTCFAKKDWQGMIACYHEKVFFYDPVFQNLEADQAKAMWEMLCKNAKEFSLSFSDIETDEEYATVGEAEGEDEYGSCKWTATYTFSKTGRKVTNQVKARFKFQDGKIIEHMDDFDLWKWSRMALGLPGVLFGWTSIIKDQIRNSAKKSLVSFMEKKSN